MKKLFSLLFILTITYVQAQYIQNAPWMENINVEARAKTISPVTFQEVVNAFNTYWENKDHTVKGSGYKPFKRWEAYWSNFVKQDGTLPTKQELWDTYLNLNGNASSKNFMTDLSDWQPVGPFTHANTGSWSSGQGRINVIVKDAILVDTYYAGAPAGGFWKSTDNGATWLTTTDDLPQIGVSGIAVDYGNPGTLYIATGDDDSGDSFSVGVMKSIDGGLTWNTTGLNAGNSPDNMNDIYVNQNDSNMLWVATNSGIFKSTDAGVSWSNTNGTQGQNMRDIKLKPGDPNIVYAVSSNRFWKSTDAGDNFTEYNTNVSGLPLASISRLVIDVTPANPDLVYVLGADNNYSFKGIYKSFDSGDNFLTIATPGTVGDIFETTQTWYDMAFAVSDVNENEIYTGVLNVWKGVVSDATNDASFTKINNWSSPFSSTYTHADIHYLRFFDGELLAGTDGGFYRSDNAAVSFTDLTAGMQISQFYRIAVSKQSSNKMVGGLQDNGGHAYNNNTWQNYYGADGMDTAIDPANSNLYYGFIQSGGGLYVSTNAGASLSGSISSPESGNWITPLTMNSDSELYAGYSSLYKLENNAFVQVSPAFGTNIDVLEIDDINPDNIFIALNSSLRKSTDRGVTFTVAENFSANITAIEVNTQDSNIVYVTTSGTNGQVYKSIDGGQNFSNISAGLPAVTKNSIKHQNLHSKNPLYLGTNLGVYRYDDDTLLWELFNIGLPTVSVRDLEINVFDNKITAATYGRGIWQSVIQTELAPTDVKLVSVSGISDAIECNAMVTPQVEIANNGITTLTSVDFIYTIDDVDNNYNWLGNLPSDASTTITLPQFSLSKGLHTFKTEATTNNDAFAINNVSEEIQILANAPGTTQVVNTFQAVTDELLVFDEGASSQYWQRGVPTGAVLNDTANPSNEVYGTNLSGQYIDNTKSYLVTECYDLTALASPEIRFDMAFQLEDNWDLVYMEYSTDQGVNWAVLGAATDPNWYNSDTLPTSNCYNCPGAQWTGQNTTLSEYSYDLTAFTAETNMMFRFVFHSDESVTREGVIVDNLVITGNLLSVDEFTTTNFSLYPNPSEGIFNIKTKTSEAFNMSIYDVTGKIILQQNEVLPSNNEHQLNMSNYAAGVYFLNISNGNNKITKKLILH